MHGSILKQDKLCSIALFLFCFISLNYYIFIYLFALIVIVSTLKFFFFFFIKQVDPITCASSGTFVTLSAVMLRLCEPFLDANLTKRDKIDANYVHYSNRLKIR